MRIPFAGVAVAGAAYILFNVNAQAAATLESGPYLQSLSSSSVWVCWWTSGTGAVGVVEWGNLSETSFEHQTSVSVDGVRAEVLLDDLQGEEKYYYRIFTDSVMLDTGHSFTAFSDTSAHFRFAVIGDAKAADFGGYICTWPYVAPLVAASDPAFCLDNGDLVHKGCDPSDWTNYWTWGSELSANYCTFPVLGNHEYDLCPWATGYIENTIVPSGPGEGYYYSFDYGNAHFAIVDDNTYFGNFLDMGSDYTPGSGQWNWLSEDLSSTDQEWKFVFFHIPGWDSAGTEGVVWGGQTVIESLYPLCRDHNVDVVFSSHVHNYQRQNYGGVNMIITGGAGGQLSPISSAYPQWTQFSLSSYHYVTVDIDGRKYTSWGTDTSGNTFDVFNLSHPPPWIQDYNGDGTSDIAVFRANSGLWSVRGITRVYFGSSGDVPVPGDYDGDRTTDIAIFRPSAGLWAVRSLSRFYLGTAGDDAVPGDYNGDGTAEAGLFQGSAGLWAIQGVTRVYFGASGDTVIPGYYDGGDTKDIAIFRGSSGGMWSVRNITRFYFGAAGDETVPGDYTGSGKWEGGIFRPSAGLWSIRNVTRIYLGSAPDHPVPADYDGDSVDDAGIFRNSNGMWSLRNLTREYFGGTGDIPVTR